MTEERRNLRTFRSAASPSEKRTLISLAMRIQSLMFMLLESLSFEYSNTL